ncbi:uncharacterized protein si:ch211-227n13.3 isoform X2 [Xyrichtys novacula]|uniref:Uncharacterized protein si:ch211-227n13.3 isoform X2 n=1 Tax=Xyrichtys novacula TaxID=13765 RepID=A0AAV1GEN2_XYRNO|nr:uncharacterized protein si:ch211-227n13.3 isoform X2 [Xyrichtys novacula]
MYPHRYHRTPKLSEKINESDLSPNEEEIQRKTNCRRQRRSKRKKSDSEVNTDERWGCDILDLINRTHEANSVTEEDEGAVTADKEVEEFDEDCLSDDCSIVSGPSILFKASPIKESQSQSLCSACQKLYLNAKRMKEPIVDKLLDNDPMSLTCDQWVLIKSWHPRRLPNPGGNLRRWARAPVKKVTKKKNKKKRKTDDPRGSRAAKQQRLHSNNHHQHVRTVSTDSNSHHFTSSPSRSPVQEQHRNQEMDSVTVKLIPCSVILKDINKFPPKQSTVKKKRTAFRDLLAQLKGNSNMIVRETR